MAMAGFAFLIASSIIANPKVARFALPGCVLLMAAIILAYPPAPGTSSYLGCAVLGVAGIASIAWGSSSLSKSHVSHDTAQASDETDAATPSEGAESETE